MKSYEYIGPVGATSVMAMDYFLREQTDINILECGRGARYDDVNQIMGFMAGINKIFIEHKDALGCTIDEVAYNKAGILKKGIKKAYTAEQNKYADRVLCYESHKVGVPLFQYGIDFKATNIRLKSNSTCFDVHTLYCYYKNLDLSILGYHQGKNSAIAIAMAEGIFGRKLKIIILKKYFKKINWPGRMEIIEHAPLTILDGCVNIESLDEVKKVLYTLFSGRKIVTVLAIPEDKDYLGVLKCVSEFSNNIIITYFENDYLKFSKNQVIESNKVIPVLFREKISEAITLSKSLLKSKNDILLFLGTQSFIRDIEILYGLSTLNI